MYRQKENRQARTTDQKVSCCTQITACHLSCEWLLAAVTADLVLFLVVGLCMLCRLLASLGPVSQDTKAILDDFRLSRTLGQELDRDVALYTLQPTLILPRSVRDSQRAQKHRWTSHPVATQQYYKTQAVRAMLEAC